MFELEEIRIRRKRLGLTQKELAELVGVSQPLIAKIESGKTDPKLSLVKKIFNVLDELEGKMVRAKDIMTTPVIHVSPDTPIEDVVEIMRKRGISQMPVIKDGKIVGCITESSILRAMISKGRRLLVKDCLDRTFPMVSPNEKIDTITSMLLESPAVLVVDEGRLVGIITKQDVMKVMK